MDVGYNVRLSPSEVVQALREAAIRKLGKKGRELDSQDEMAFHHDAGVFLKMKGTDQPQSVSVVEEVTVTWAE